MNILYSYDRQGEEGWLSIFINCEVIKPRIFSPHSLNFILSTPVLCLTCLSVFCWSKPCTMLDYGYCHCIMHGINNAIPRRQQGISIVQAWLKKVPTCSIPSHFALLLCNIHTLVELEFIWFLLIQAMHDAWTMDMSCHCIMHGINNAIPGRQQGISIVQAWLRKVQMCSILNHFALLLCNIHTLVEVETSSKPFKNNLQGHIKPPKAVGRPVR